MTNYSVVHEQLQPEDGDLIILWGGYDKFNLPYSDFLINRPDFLDMSNIEILVFTDFSYALSIVLNNDVEKYLEKNKIQLNIHNYEQNQSHVLYFYDTFDTNKVIYLYDVSDFTYFIISVKDHSLCGVVISNFHKEASSLKNFPLHSIVDKIRKDASSFIVQ